MATVFSINKSVERGTEKTAVSRAVLIENYGLLGDAHAGLWPRQVSLLAWESMDRLCDEEVEPGTYQENITTKGLAVNRLLVGSILRVGTSVLEVTQIGIRCEQECRRGPGACQCSMSGEGVFARVLRGGMMHKDDVITLEAQVNWAKIKAECARAPEAVS